MLWITPIRDVDYYTERAAGCETDPLDYYLGRKEAPGRWSGAGAERLGLSGGLTLEQLHGEFKRLVEGGILPGEHQRASAREHTTPGFDLTMSAPKSVSLLAGLGDAYVSAAARDAHGAAVAAGLAYLEAHTSIVRRGDGGSRYEAAVPGLIGVEFRHREARPCEGCDHGDPQLHSHVVVANLAQAASDGRWLALDSDLMHNHATTAGYVYQAVLRGELTERLGVAWNRPENGCAEIAGIPESWLKQFSKRTAAVSEYQQAEYDAELELIDDPKVGSRKAEKRAILATRQPKGESLDETKLRDGWAAEGAEHGITAENMWERVVHAAERAVHRPLPAVDLSRLTEAESSFTRADVTRAVANSARRGARLSKIEPAVDQALTSDELVPVLFHRDPVTGQQMRGQDPREPRFTTRAQLDLEQRVLDSAARRRGEGSGIVDEDRVREAVHAPGLVTLGEDQEAMVRALLRDGDGVTLVVAAAGTGKTTALGAATSAWQSEGLRVVGCAAGGKAAGELAERTGMSTSTIAQTFVDLTRGEGLPAGGVLVVDEAGVVGTRDMARLVAAAEAARTKLVMVGDPAQLQPVASGGIVRALVAQNGAAELTTNRRQQEQWQRDALESVRDGHGAEGLDRFVAEGRVTVAETPVAAQAACVADYWRASQADPTQAIMLARANSDVADLNRLAQRVARESGRLSGPVASNRFAEIQAGDRVICRDTTQGRRYGVHNGDLATCAGVQDGRLTLDLDKGGRVELPEGYTAKVSLGYALTAHRAQGSTVDRAFVYGSGGREWSYTALSRARGDSRVYLSSGANDRAEIDLPRRAQVDAIAAARRAVSQSEAKMAAVDIAPKSLGDEELRGQIERTAELLRQRPTLGVAVPVVRAEVEHLQQDIAAERERLAAAASVDRGGRWRRGGTVTADRSTEPLERLTGRLETAQQQLGEAEGKVAARAGWDDEHMPKLAAGVEAADELGWRQQARNVAAEIEWGEIEAPELEWGEPVLERSA
jgi:conjugative relaxase-like TrwC/TraI family protein